MLEQHSHARELQHAEEVFHVPFPTSHESPRVVEPGKEPLHNPAAFGAAQRATILGRRPDPAVAVRRDQFNVPVGPQLRVQGVAVVGAIADQPRRVRVEEPIGERVVDEPNFIW